MKKAKGKKARARRASVNKKCPKGGGTKIDFAVPFAFRLNPNPHVPGQVQATVSAQPRADR